MRKRWMHIERCLAVLIALSICQPALADQPRLTASFHDDGVTVLENNSPVLSYQSRPRSLEGSFPRANYVHPLYDLRGQVITEDFPDDHPHHRGIFWAWHQVWVGDQRLGDSWACQDFQWDVHSLAASTPGDPVSLNATTYWKSPQLVDRNGQPIAVVKEQIQIDVHAAQPSYRVIDFHLSLLALVLDVRIGGSDDEKGYGGFSPRIHLTGDEQFLSESGEIEPVIPAISAGTWMNITRKDSGFAILVHRDNPQVNNQTANWILRRSQSMQNAVYPGREPVPISNVKPTVLRYRIVVHDGSLTAESIRDLQADFWQTL